MDRTSKIAKQMIQNQMAASIMSKMRCNLFPQAFDTNDILNLYSNENIIAAAARKARISSMVKKIASAYFFDDDSIYHLNNTYSLRVAKKANNRGWMSNIFNEVENPNKEDYREYLRDKRDEKNYEEWKEFNRALSENPDEWNNYGRDRQKSGLSSHERINHYILSEDKKDSYGNHIIVATRRFRKADGSFVDKGEEGGGVANESCIDQYGTSWVEPGSSIGIGCHLSDHSLVRKNSVIMGNVKIIGDSIVENDIYGNVMIQNCHISFEGVNSEISVDKSFKMRDSLFRGEGKFHVGTGEAIHLTVDGGTVDMKGDFVCHNGFISDGATISGENSILIETSTVIGNGVEIDVSTDPIEILNKCVITGNAKVSGNLRIVNGTRIYGNAVIDAKTLDKAEINHSNIYGDAKLNSFAEISDSSIRGNVVINDPKAVIKDNEFEKGAKHGVLSQENSIEGKNLVDYARESDFSVPETDKNSGVISSSYDENVINAFIGNSTVSAKYVLDVIDNHSPSFISKIINSISLRFSSDNFANEFSKGIDYDEFKKIIAAQIYSGSFDFTNTLSEKIFKSFDLSKAKAFESDLVKNSLKSLPKEASDNLLKSMQSITGDDLKSDFDIEDSDISSYRSKIRGDVESIMEGIDRCLGIKIDNGKLEYSTRIVENDEGKPEGGVNDVYEEHRIPLLSYIKELLSVGDANNIIDAFDRCLHSMCDGAVIREFIGAYDNTKNTKPILYMALGYDVINNEKLVSDKSHLRKLYVDLNSNWKYESNYKAKAINDAICNADFAEIVFDSNDLELAVRGYEFKHGSLWYHAGKKTNGNYSKYSLQASFLNSIIGSNREELLEDILGNKYTAPGTIMYFIRNFKDKGYVNGKTLEIILENDMIKNSPPDFLDSITQMVNDINGIEPSVSSGYSISYRERVRSIVSSFMPKFISLLNKEELTREGYRQYLDNLISELNNEETRRNAFSAFIRLGNEGYQYALQLVRTYGLNRCQALVEQYFDECRLDNGNGVYGVIDNARYNFIKSMVNKTGKNSKDFSHKIQKKTSVLVNCITEGLSNYKKNQADKNYKAENSLFEEIKKAIKNNGEFNNSDDEIEAAVSDLFKEENKIPYSLFTLLGVKDANDLNYYGIMDEASFAGLKKKAFELTRVVRENGIEFIDSEIVTDCHKYHFDSANKKTFNYMTMEEQKDDNGNIKEVPVFHRMSGIESIEYIVNQNYYDNSKFNGKYAILDESFINIPQDKLNEDKDLSLAFKAFKETYLEFGSNSRNYWNSSSSHNTFDFIDGMNGGQKVYRILCISPFDINERVKKGMVGGFVHDLSNLDEKGNCWIYDDSKVGCGARVIDNATVCGNSIVTDVGTVIADNAIIADGAMVSDGSVVGGNARVLNVGTIVKGESTIIGNAVVWRGSKLDKRVEVSKDENGKELYNERGKLLTHSVRTVITDEAVVAGKIINGDTAQSFDGRLASEKTCDNYIKLEADSIRNWEELFDFYRNYIENVAEKNSAFAENALFSNIRDNKYGFFEENGMCVILDNGYLECKIDNKEVARLVERYNKYFHFSNSFNEIKKSIDNGELNRPIQKKDNLKLSKEIEENRKIIEKATEKLNDENLSEEEQIELEEQIEEAEEEIEVCFKQLNINVESKIIDIYISNLNDPICYLNSLKKLDNTNYSINSVLNAVSYFEYKFISSKLEEYEKKEKDNDEENQTDFYKKLNKFVGINESGNNKAIDLIEHYKCLGGKINYGVGKPLEESLQKLIDATIDVLNDKTLQEDVKGYFNIARSNYNDLISDFLDKIFNDDTVDFLQEFSNNFEGLISIIKEYNTENLSNISENHLDSNFRFKIISIERASEIFNSIVNKIETKKSIFTGKLNEMQDLSQVFVHRLDFTVLLNKIISYQNNGKIVKIFKDIYDNIIKYTNDLCEVKLKFEKEDDDNYYFAQNVSHIIDAISKVSYNLYDLLCHFTESNDFFGKDLNALENCSERMTGESSSMIKFMKKNFIKNNCLEAYKKYLSVKNGLEVRNNVTFDEEDVNGFITGNFRNEFLKYKSIFYEISSKDDYLKLQNEINDVSKISDRSSMCKTFMKIYDLLSKFHYEIERDNSIAEKLNSEMSDNFIWKSIINEFQNKNTWWKNSSDEEKNNSILALIRLLSCPLNQKMYIMKLFDCWNNQQNEDVQKWKNRLPKAWQTKESEELIKKIRDNGLPATYGDIEVIVKEVRKNNAVYDEQSWKNDYEAALSVFNELTRVFVVGRTFEKLVAWNSLDVDSTTVYNSEIHENISLGEYVFDLNSSPSDIIDYISSSNLDPKKLMKRLRDYIEEDEINFSFGKIDEEKYKQKKSKAEIVDAILRKLFDVNSIHVWKSNSEILREMKETIISALKHKFPREVLDKKVENYEPKMNEWKENIPSDYELSGIQKSMHDDDEAAGLYEEITTTNSDQLDIDIKNFIEENVFLKQDPNDYIKHDSHNSNDDDLKKRETILSRCQKYAYAVLYSVRKYNYILSINEQMDIVRNAGINIYKDSEKAEQELKDGMMNPPCFLTEKSFYESNSVCSDLVKIRTKAGIKFSDRSTYVRNSYSKRYPKSSGVMIQKMYAISTTGEEASKFLSEAIKNKFGDYSLFNTDIDRFNAEKLTQFVREKYNAAAFSILKSKHTILNSSEMMNLIYAFRNNSAIVSYAILKSPSRSSLSSKDISDIYDFINSGECSFDENAKRTIVTSIANFERGSATSNTEEENYSYDYSVEDMKFDKQIESLHKIREKISAIKSKININEEEKKKIKIKNDLSNIDDVVPGETTIKEINEKINSEKEVLKSAQENRSDLIAANEAFRSYCDIIRKFLVENNNNYLHSKSDFKNEISIQRGIDRMLEEISLRIEEAKHTKQNDTPKELAAKYQSDKETLDTFKEKYSECASAADEEKKKYEFSIERSKKRIDSLKELLKKNSSHEYRQYVKLKNSEEKAYGIVLRHDENSDRINCVVGTGNMNDTSKHFNNRLLRTAPLMKKYFYSIDLPYLEEGEYVVVKWLYAKNRAAKNSVGEFALKGRPILEMSRISDNKLFTVYMPEDIFENTVYRPKQQDESGKNKKSSNDEIFSETGSELSVSNIVYAICVDVGSYVNSSTMLMIVGPGSGILEEKRNDELTQEQLEKQEERIKKELSDEVFNEFKYLTGNLMNNIKRNHLLDSFNACWSKFIGTLLNRLNNDKVVCDRIANAVENKFCDLFAKSMSTSISYDKIVDIMINYVDNKFNILKDEDGSLLVYTNEYSKLVSMSTKEDEKLYNDYYDLNYDSFVENKCTKPLYFEYNDGMPEMIVEEINEIIRQKVKNLFIEAVKEYNSSNIEDTPFSEYVKDDKQLKECVFTKDDRTNLVKEYLMNLNPNVVFSAEAKIKKRNMRNDASNSDSIDNRLYPVFCKFVSEDYNRNGIPFVNVLIQEKAEQKEFADTISNIREQNEEYIKNLPANSPEYIIYTHFIAEGYKKTLFDRFTEGLKSLKDSDEIKKRQILTEALPKMATTFNEFYNSHKKNDKEKNNILADICGKKFKGMQMVVLTKKLGCSVEDINKLYGDLVKDYNDSISKDLNASDLVSDAKKFEKIEIPKMAVLTNYGEGEYHYEDLHKAEEAEIRDYFKRITEEKYIDKDLLHKMIEDDKNGYVVEEIALNFGADSNGDHISGIEIYYGDEIVLLYDRLADIVLEKIENGQRLDHFKRFIKAYLSGKKSNSQSGINRINQFVDKVISIGKNIKENIFELFRCVLKNKYVNYETIRKILEFIRTIDEIKKNASALVLNDKLDCTEKQWIDAQENNAYWWYDRIMSAASELRNVLDATVGGGRLKKSEENNVFNMFCINLYAGNHHTAYEVNLEDFMDAKDKTEAQCRMCLAVKSKYGTQKELKNAIDNNNKIIEDVNTQLNDKKLNLSEEEKNKLEEKKRNTEKQNENFNEVFNLNVLDYLGKTTIESHSEDEEVMAESEAVLWKLDFETVNRLVNHALNAVENGLKIFKAGINNSISLYDLYEDLNKKANSIYDDIYKPDQEEQDFPNTGMIDVSTNFRKRMHNLWMKKQQEINKKNQDIVNQHKINFDSLVRTSIENSRFKEAVNDEMASSFENHYELIRNNYEKYSSLIKSGSEIIHIINAICERIKNNENLDFLEHMELFDKYFTTSLRGVNGNIFIMKFLLNSIKLPTEDLKYGGKSKNIILRLAKMKYCAEGGKGYSIFNQAEKADNEYIDKLLNSLNTSAGEFNKNNILLMVDNANAGNGFVCKPLKENESEEESMSEEEWIDQNLTSQQKNAIGRHGSIPSKMMKAIIRIANRIADDILGFDF